MRNSIISVHLHLGQLESSLMLIDGLKEVWDGKVYASFNQGCEHNAILLDRLAEKFDHVDPITVKDMGNDQYGFIKSFKGNQDDTDYILYAHDRTHTKKFKKATDPILKHPGGLESLVDNMIKLDCGIASAGSTKEQMLSMYELDVSHGAGFLSPAFKKFDEHQSAEYRLGPVQSMQTVLWFHELARWARWKTNSMLPTIYPHFSGGNCFLAHREIVTLAHACAPEEFFEEGYKPDGKVEHALERLYFYISNTIFSKPTMWIVEDDTVGPNVIHKEETK